MSLTATMRLDVRLQSRSRLYTIGIGVAVLFGVLGKFLFADADTGRVLTGFYLLGVGSTTYIFGASLVLLEKSQGTLQALRASPLTASAYIGSKVLTLTTFALVESAIVYAIAFPDAAANFAILVLGVASLGALYALIGLGQVAPHDSVTSFLMPGAMLVGSVVQLPILYLLDVGPSTVWYLVPTQAPLLLMLGAFEHLEAWQWAYALAMTVVAMGVARWWALRRFARFIELAGG